jgi:GNAT superfamily N-acetyltransferase
MSLTAAREARVPLPRSGEPAVPTLRHLADGETEVLDQVFDALSERSRYLRFHAPVARLSDPTRAMLARTGPDRVLMAAFAPAMDGRAPQPIGLLRLVEVGLGRAELAVEVVDGWQGRGIGRRLVRTARTAARQRGYDLLFADVLTENPAMHRLLRTEFPEARVVRHGQTFRFVLPVAAGHLASVRE